MTPKEDMQPRGRHPMKHASTHEPRAYIPSRNPLRTHGMQVLLTAPRTPGQETQAILYMLLARRPHILRYNRACFVFRLFLWNQRNQETIPLAL